MSIWAIIGWCFVGLIVLVGLTICYLVRRANKAMRREDQEAGF